LWSAKTKEPGTGWAAKYQPPTAVEGSRFKMVGPGTLPTYKKVVAWSPGPMEDTGRYLQWLQRLNQGPGPNLATRA
jgi:hypothetical protein